MGHHGETINAQQVEELEMAGRAEAPLDPAFGVGEEPQAAAGAEPGIEQLEAPGRGVAGIGEEPLAALALETVQARQLRVGHIHLAADFDDFGAEVVIVPETQWDILDRAHVMRDVIATMAIAPGRTQDEAALLVEQGHGDAVDLVLDHVFRPRPLEPAPDTGVELPDIGFIVGVVDR